MSELAQPMPLSSAFASVPGENTPQAASSNVKPFKTIDVMAEQGKAYDLESQINASDKARQAKNDQDLVQSALKQGGDLSTPDGVKQMAEQLKGQVAPATYANLIKMHGELKAATEDAQTRLMKTDSAKLEQTLKQSDFVLKEMTGLMDDYESDVKEKGVAKALEEFETKKQAKIKALEQMDVLPPKAISEFSKMSPGEVVSKIKSSTFYKDQVTSALKNKEIEAKTRLLESKGETEQAGGQAAVAYNNAVEQYGEDSPQAKAALNKMSGRGSAGGSGLDASLTPEAIDMAASRLLSGDKTALQNIGRGAQGSANIAAINNRVASMAKEQNKGPQDILRAQADLSSANKGLQQLAGRSSKIDAAAIEVDKFAQNALSSLDKVSRGDIVPVNSILQKVSLGAGSPEEAEFATYVQSLVGAYATVIGRGSPTVHSQEKAAKIIRKDYSKPQFAAMVKALQNEAKSVQESSVDAAKNIKKETFGEAGMKERIKGDMGPDPKVLDKEIAATTADIQKVTDPTSKQELTAHLADLQRQKKNIGNTNTTKNFSKLWE